MSTTIALLSAGHAYAQKASLAEGYYSNPILAGDYPDPSVFRDGDDYYMTHSSFEYYPGLLIWHSTDLVNWTPIGHALHTNVGSVWQSSIVDELTISPPQAASGSPGIDLGVGRCR